MNVRQRVNLDDVAIAAPCRIDWNDMVGTDQIRLCGQCNLNVYNISEMTRKEAEDLLTSHKGSHFCLKIFRRSDGTILTKDCSVGRRILDRARLKIRLLIVSIMGFLNISPAIAQGYFPQPQVDRYGFGVVNGAPTVGPPNPKPYAPQRLIAGRIGEGGNAGANMSALDAFNKAQEFELTYKNPEVALGYYAGAVYFFRANKAMYDTKFIRMVGSKYARLLRKLGSVAQAKAIEKEFCRK